MLSNGELRRINDMNPNRSQVISTIFLVFAVVAARLLPHPPNVTPLTAVSLFSGFTLTGKSKYIVPIASLLLSDILLGFHTTMPYVYGSFLLIVLLGSYIGNSPGAFRLIGFTVSSTTLFFLITNFGVWYSSSMYQHNSSGLIQAYLMGVPFYRTMMIGDVFYVVSLFYLLRHVVVPHAAHAPDKTIIVS